MELEWGQNEISIQFEWWWKNDNLDGFLFVFFITHTGWAHTQNDPTLVSRPRHPYDLGPFSVHCSE